MLSVKWILIVIVIWATYNCQAQDKRIHRKGEFYFSWGYNKDWYTKSTVKISQPDLGNKYQFKIVSGHDHPGWDEKDFFSKDLTIPQYNYRLGYFFNNKKNLGVEINFDHTKFIITNGQSVKIIGNLNNRFTDSSLIFSEENGFFYYLNNGANFLLFNIVKRWQWYQNKNIKIDLLVKAGIGPVIPHVENNFFGQRNNPGFQFGGWNTGTEGVIRTTFLNHVYVEFSGKLDYARYSNLKIYKGAAKHAFGTAEVILSIGYTFKQGGYTKQKRKIRE
ncbi:MAG: hypothetical protein M3004_05040 [Bacteroidota bacterium]|nr:hypothetical protein [Bacteroidota bacterium]